MSCCRGNPICQPVSLSPLPLSPCEDDDGLRFLFLHLQLHPATAPDVAQARDASFERASGGKRAPAENAAGSESGRRLRFCEGACLMEQGAKVRRRRRRRELSLRQIGARRGQTEVGRVS